MHGGGGPNFSQQVSYASSLCVVSNSFQRRLCSHIGCMCEVV